MWLPVISYVAARWVTINVSVTVVGTRRAVSVLTIKRNRLYHNYSNKQTFP